MNEPLTRRGFARFPSMPNWLRVTIGTPQGMRRFQAAFRAVVPARQIRAA
jgi:histidinol-phosphate/aromatic aminotransferase/cobyric acid decarboxylase-like protein